MRNVPIRRAATRDAYLQGLIGRRGASVRLQIARMTLQSAVASVKRGVKRLGAFAYAARAWMAFAVLAPLYLDQSRRPRIERRQVRTEPPAIATTELA